MFSEEMCEMFEESVEFVAVDCCEELDEAIAETKDECTCDLCVTRFDE